MAERIVPRISVVRDLFVRRFLRCGVEAGNKVTDLQSGKQSGWRTAHTPCCVRLSWPSETISLIEKIPNHFLAIKFQISSSSNLLKLRSALLRHRQQ